jgi:hypothetical protein
MSLNVFTAHYILAGEKLLAVRSSLCTFYSILLTIPPTFRANASSALKEIAMRVLLRFSVVLLLVALSQPALWSQGGLPAGCPYTAASTVLTYHYDNNRSGVNARETTLTPANVNSQQFGLIANYQLDGEVNGEPLYVALSIATAQHHYLYAATENDSIYMIDTDDGAPVWKTSLLGNQETPEPGLHGTATFGVSGTPVIDLAMAKCGAIYAVSSSVDAGGNYHFRLHALDLLTGAELAGGPVEITATYPGTGDGSSGGTVYFQPSQYFQRSSLLLANNTIYVTFASRADQRPYTGWVMAYSKATLKQTGVIDITANGIQGSIWMAGSGPAADAEGNVYLVDGNGTFDAALNTNNFPASGDFGNTLVKIDTVAGQLTVTDYFAPNDIYYEAANDLDYGSSGITLLPLLRDQSGTYWHLAATSSKEGNIYLNNLNSLGKYNPSGGVAYQEIDGAVPSGVFSTPVYFNGNLYLAGKGDYIRAFSIVNAKVTSTPPKTTPTSFIYPGTVPIVSANGTQNGILWAVDQGPAGGGYEVLHAYNANNISVELYNSSQAPNGRDNLGTPFHFTTPTVVDGRVYVRTTGGVAVFGLLN